MISMPKSNDTTNKLPTVSKELVDYLKTKVVSRKYNHGDTIKPEDVAYIYGQQSIYEIVCGLYTRSNNDGKSLFNTKAERASGGKPGGYQEESLFGPTEE